MDKTASCIAASSLSPGRENGRWLPEESPAVADEVGLIHVPGIGCDARPSDIRLLKTETEGMVETADTPQPFHTHPNMLLTPVTHRPFREIERLNGIRAQSRALLLPPAQVS